MFQRHKKSLELDVETVSMEDGHWRYENEQSNYTITMEKERCDEPRCKIRCVDCNICIHNYSCTCTDYFLNNITCKHIHLVRRIQNKDVKQSERKIISCTNKVSDGQYFIS